MHPSTSSTLQRDPVTHRILGAYFGVYRELGFGFLEAVYRRSLVVMLKRMGAQVCEEVRVPVRFKGELVGSYRADLVVDGAVIVEVKTAEALNPAHRAQLLNYLKATPIEVGMLLNFGPTPSFERLVFANARKVPRPLQF
jgi:GxxExxY protein